MRLQELLKQRDFKEPKTQHSQESTRDKHWVKSMQILRPLDYCAQVCESVVVSWIYLPSNPLRWIAEKRRRGRLTNSFFFLALGSTRQEAQLKQLLLRLYLQIPSCTRDDNGIERKTWVSCPVSFPKLRCWALGRRKSNQHFIQRSNYNVRRSIFITVIVVLQNICKSGWSWKKFWYDADSYTF